MDKDNKRLYQVQYFIEENCVGKKRGYDINPLEIGKVQQEIENFSNKKIRDSRYLINGVIVELHNKKSLEEYLPQDSNFSGEMGIRFIGDEASKKNFSDLAKRLCLPFSEERIILYDGD